MTDKRLKSFLEDRLKRLESIKDEREFTTAELGDIACCKQTLAFIDSLQEEPVNIWHDGCEIPKSETDILMIRKEEKDTNYPPIAGCFHGTNSRLDGRNWGYYNGFCYNEIEPPVKWAYIDELLKLSEYDR